MQGQLQRKFDGRASVRRFGGDYNYESAIPGRLPARDEEVN
jgi:hypothetical protein